MPLASQGFEGHFNAFQKAKPRPRPQSSKPYTNLLRQSVRRIAIKRRPRVERERHATFFLLLCLS